MNHRVYYLRGDRKVVYNPDGTYYLSRGEPLVCIVSEVNSETSEIRYGYSIVHPIDRSSHRYSKSEGRKLAIEKFFSHPSIVKSESKNGHDINRDMVNHFSETVGKENGTARKTSHRWLKHFAAVANRFSKEQEAQKAKD